jgi:uncharacterized protein (TIGR02421 family)
MIPKYLVEADSRLHDIASDLHFLAVNPKNGNDTKKKFLKSKECPKFIYNTQLNRIEQNKNALQNITLEHTPIDSLLRKKQKELSNKCDMYSNLGSKKFTTFSKKVWGKPDKKLISKAYEILDLPESPKQENISSKQSLSLLQTALKDYNIHNMWSIKRMDRTSSSAAIRFHEKVLSLKTKQQFSKKYIQRLIVHEVGTHILRYENAMIQPLKIFRVGLSNYLSTEEGLAAYNEDVNKVLSKSVLRQYAGRVIAVSLAQRMSFLEVFNELKKCFSEEEAFKLTFRAKRGIADTNESGGCTKDYVYLKGYYEVQEYINRGEAYEDLYIGKVGISDLPTIRKIPEIRSPRFIPHSIEQTSLNAFI